MACSGGTFSRPSARRDETSQSHGVLNLTNGVAQASGASIKAR